MEQWQNIKQNITNNFGSAGFAENWLAYLLQLIMFTILYYLMFKVLRNNKADKFVGIIVFFIVFAGLALSFSSEIESGFLFIIISMCALLVFTMYHTEIKRTLLDAGVKKGKAEPVTVTGVELIMDEIVRAVQNMSKNDIGALIVLSNDNLPEGIIESGTVINSKITSQLIETVFFPKTPLHDGALVVVGNKLYAAGCFLPLAQDERLPKEMGSRHRAALGVTMVASVTAIVVSEETGIISIVKNGVIKKKYADATDIKEALSDYYWSDLTAESIM